MSKKRIAIYQVLVRLFGNTTKQPVFNGSIAENGCGKMNDFTAKALNEVRKMGFTHIWYTGLLEHATQTNYEVFGIRPDHPAVVKGRAGSPYAVKDYYDIDPDLACDVEKRMNEFESLVERTHSADLKIIMDFIPNHVARAYYSDAKPDGVVDLGETDHTEWAFSPLNNFYYCQNQLFNPTFDINGYVEFPAKVTGNDCFSANPNTNDWYETVKLNYGVHYLHGAEKHFTPIPNTWYKMYEMLRFWAAKNVDGFRCDMAEMVPVEFWNWVISKLKAEFPELIFIAEVYNPMLYRAYIYEGKFDYLYDKVGLYDKLRHILTSNHSASDITQCWQATSDIANHMLNFLENHDEQRIASDFFCGKAHLAFPAVVAMCTLWNNPIMMYAGQELGESGMDSEGFSGCDGRTTIFDYWPVKSLQNWYNEGKFTLAQLTAEQKTIRNFYLKVLRLATAENSIVHGKFYDLQYANFDNRSFDTHKQYAFLRYFENEFILVVINFDNAAKVVRVNIPSEAFDFLQLPSVNGIGAKDILNTQEPELIFNLQANSSIQIAVFANNARMIKFTV